MTNEEFENVPIPNGYKEIKNDVIVELNDKYICKIESLRNYSWNLITSNMIGEKCKIWECWFRFIRKVESPEELEKQIKNKSKEFVNKYISNPTPEDYEKFEQTFLRQDNFGL